MGAKEAIKYLRILDEETGLENEKEFRDIIELLQRGENYEAMWGRLREREGWRFYMQEAIHNIFLYDIMNKFEQRYFPKPVKKTITIEFEADADHMITHHINILKADLERRKDCPTVKYTFKE